MKIFKIKPSTCVTAIAVIALIIGSQTVNAQIRRDIKPGDRADNVRVSRREDVRDRKENIRDRREDVKDRREDKRDALHNGGRKDKIEDKLDKRED